MTYETKYQRNLTFLRLSFNFLNVTESVLKKSIDNRNKAYVIADDEISEEIFAQKTEFSDDNILIPSLFCLYHGLELLLKGFILYKIDDSEIKKIFDHEISVLKLKFCTFYPEENNMKNIFNSYIGKENCIEPLKTFYIKNDISSDKFFEAFKYPIKKSNFFDYNYTSLLSKEIENIPFFEKCVGDISHLKRLSVTLWRSFEK